MALVQERQINGDLSFNADLVYGDVKVSNYSQGLAWTATSGWVRIGACSVASDQSFQVGVETEPVETGTPITAKDDLITRLSGEGSFLITDLNPHAARTAMGTTGAIQWDTSGTTYTGTVNATTSTKQVIYVDSTTGAAANDIIKFELSSGNNLYYYPGIVDSVGADNLTLKYPLPEIPAESSSFERVRGYDLYHGGNTLQNYKTLVQLEFPKGDQHVMEILKNSFVGGYTRQMGGAVKTPLQAKMYGVLQDVGSLTDQVTLAVTHVQFPNYA